MNWFGAGVDGPLIAIRAIHFAATAVTTGTLVFRAVVAKPAFRSEDAVAKLFGLQNLRVAWTGLAITVVSGVIWLLLQTASMSGLPLSEAITPGVLVTILNETQFGSVAEIRVVLAIILAICLAYDGLPLAHRLGPVAAVGLTGAIAWTGHAASTLGVLGNLHLTADALHLLAAAGWIGGLVSLVLLLAASRNHQAFAGAALTWDATRRFSTLGIVSVGTLLATGIVNAWILVGSFHALVVTGYGRLLLLKIAVFAIMLAFAAVNRIWLTPRLVRPGSELRLEALHRLTRNSAVEIALGLTIFAIVGALGTLHPAIHGV